MTVREHGVLYVFYTEYQFHVGVHVTITFTSDAVPQESSLINHDRGQEKLAPEPWDYPCTVGSIVSRP